MHKEDVGQNPQALNHLKLSEEKKAIDMADLTKNFGASNDISKT